MPGALAVESLVGDDGGGEPQENGGSMDVDDDDDEQILTRPCTPEPARVDDAFSTPGFAPIQTEVISADCVCGYHLGHFFHPGLIFFSLQAWCAIHRNQVDSTRVMIPAMTACRGCESKTQTIESNEKVISELQGNLQVS